MTFCVKVMVPILHSAGLVLRGQIATAPQARVQVQSRSADEPQATRRVQSPKDGTESRLPLSTSHIPKRQGWAIRPIAPKVSCGFIETRKRLWHSDFAVTLTRPARASSKTVPIARGQAPPAAATLRDRSGIRLRTLWCACGPRDQEPISRRPKPVRKRPIGRLIGMDPWRNLLYPWRR